MIRIGLAATTALVLFGGAAAAQTTGTALGIPKNVESSSTPTSDGRAGPAPRPERNPDPWEGFNRRSYGFSMALDRAVIGPGARAYKRAVPKPIRTGLHNMIVNLGEPVVFANDVLQGRLGSAGNTAVRFVGNSTFGIGGIFDVAAHGGLPHHDNSVGITLGRMGVGPGPYIYVPVLGPTTIRDGIGQGLDTFLNPLTYSRFDGDTILGVSSTVIGGVDVRANVDDDLKSLETTATDPYATIRSAYLQNKQAQISGGDTRIETLPDFPDDSSQGAAPTGADPFASPAPAPPGASRRAAPGPATDALPDFPDNPQNPPPPADAPPPSGGLSGLY